MLVWKLSYSPTVPLLTDLDQEEMRKSDRDTCFSIKQMQNWKAAMPPHLASKAVAQLRALGVRPGLLPSRDFAPNPH